MQQMQDEGKLVIELDGTEISLDDTEIEVRLQAKEGWAAAQGRSSVVVLSTELTPALIREGYARDMVRLIQETRKQRDCNRTDRIHVYIIVDDAELKSALEENRDYIAGETLALEIRLPDTTNLPADVQMDTFEIEGQPIQVGILVVPQVAT